ncbi:MAG: RDD family protein [bacterium]|nr:RDD family protein [bacterium]
MTESNPYAAPTAPVRDVRRRASFTSASRGSRLGATIIDTLIMYAFWAVGFGVGFFMDSDGLGLAIMAIGTIGFFVWQLVLLSQNGWTLGKKILGIRIVRVGGVDASLGRILGLRIIVNGLLSLIPLYAIIDTLWIFGEQSRCVHDLLADTIVIEA